MSQLSTRTSPTTFSLFLSFSSLVATGWVTEMYTIELRPLQGPLMIVAMKVLSVYMSKAPRKSIKVDLFLHYCLSPSSVVFGPIVPFDDFQQRIFQAKFSLPFRSLLNGITSTFLTFIAANCVCQSVEWAYTGQDVAPYHIVSDDGEVSVEDLLFHGFILFLLPSAVPVRLQTGAGVQTEPLLHLLPVHPANAPGSPEISGSGGGLLGH